VLLEVARSALARGDGRAALEALTAHEERHPRGQLAEEREAMVVQALASAGRRNEAVARAARFRLAYPTSVLLPIVDAAVR
jgi:outer membrane protein assembly factor BamD (BamD/ComL family)